MATSPYSFRSTKYELSMPLLKPEQDIWPLNLLDLPAPDAPVLDDHPWWALYTMARFEKKLMRQLLEIQVPFFGPTIPRRYRSPQGRIRTSIEPLFSNYVFIKGDEVARYNAVCTGSVSRWMPVPDPAQLVEDLRQIRNLILTDEPMSPELRLEPGQKVRVKTGVFKGFEGTILRRENEIRLLISVRYMGRGASVALDDCQLEAI
jgi:transcription antitermination factor NusG